jgi:hypothetical protein
MPIPVPARISSDGRTATWNPALTRAARVAVEVRLPTGELAVRTSLNSGRVKVREVERIERILAEE